MNALNYPPHRTHLRQRVPQNEALGLIQDFLEQARTTTYLHADAKLWQGGPSRNENIESLAIQHLRRIEAGLRGEKWGEDLSNSAVGEVETEHAGHKTVFDEDDHHMETGVNHSVQGTEDTLNGTGETAEALDTIAKGQIVDKEERKRKKKERRQKEKRETESKRKREQQMEE